MRRFTSMILAVAIGVIATLSLAAVAVARPAPGTQAAAAPKPSICTADGGQIAHPTTLLLGETAAITMYVRAMCAGSQVPTHYVLVADTSDAMDRSLVHELQDAMTTLVARLNLKDSPGTKVGIVAVDDEAKALSQLTNNAARLFGAIGRIDAGTDTRMDLGILEGVRMLTMARQDLVYPEIVNEVMITFSDGDNAGGCSSAQRAARRAKSAGVLVITVCVGRKCAKDCMRRVASARRYAFEWLGWSALLSVGNHIRIDHWKIGIRRMTVTQNLPAGVDYVTDSADPPATEIGADGKRLVWTENFVPVDGLTITLRVRPRAVGYKPVSAGAKAEFWDTYDHTGGFYFANPFVEVLAPFPVPTPTDAAP